MKRTQVRSALRSLFFTKINRRFKNKQPLQLGDETDAAGEANRESIQDYINFSSENILLYSYWHAR